MPSDDDDGNRSTAGLNYVQLYDDDDNDDDDGVLFQYLL
jgi:hypothetical protein